MCLLLERTGNSIRSPRLVTNPDTADALILCWNCTLPSASLQLRILPSGIFLALLLAFACSLASPCLAPQTVLPASHVTQHTALGRRCLWEAQHKLLAAAACERLIPSLNARRDVIVLQHGPKGVLAQATAFLALTKHDINCKGGLQPAQSLA